MKKFKKLLLLCAAFMATISIAACGGDTPSSSSPDSSEPAVETSSPDESSPDESSPDESSPDESSPDESSPDESSPDESSPDEENPDGPTQEELAAMGAILEQAYALESGATMDGTHTLTGTVTDVEKTGEGEACLTFVVKGYDQYPMYCYWLKGEEAGNLKVGDIITYGYD